MATHKFLIVVDMQNDFIDGTLGTREAVAIVVAAAERIRACRVAVDTLIATLDTHDEDYMQTQEGLNLPVPHCIRCTAGWQLRPEIAEALGEDAIRVEKPAFGSVNLPEVIAKKLAPGETPEFELLGLCTDICVVSNALLVKAFLPEVPITVDAACCAGVTPASHKNALEAMKLCQIRIVNE
jgi:nicotinamidase-related amidase